MNKMPTKICTPTNTIRTGLRKLSRKASTVLKDFLRYLTLNGRFYDDPQDNLLISGESEVVPLVNGEDGPLNKVFFDQTHALLNSIFRTRLISAHISYLSAETVFRTSVLNLPIFRAYVPLVLPHPPQSSGVWMYSPGIRYFIDGSWIGHPLSTKHCMFNYSTSDVYILILDLSLA